MTPARGNTHSGSSKGLWGLVSAVLPLGLLTAFIYHWPDVAGGQAISISWPWMPSLDLNLSFRLDGLSLLFALIVCTAGVFVTLYSHTYMAGHAHKGRYFVFLHGFMLSMLGIVTADNLLLLFVCWEGTTIFSYLLIGFDHESARARRNARQALLITAGGGMALLIAVLLLKIAGGTYTISQWTAGGDEIRSHGLYPFILIMALLGAFTKSAQFPFHFWLPNAMSAPTPISAFLHAATMVKAGIYLLMRFHPLLGGTTAWMLILVFTGGITAIWSALQAFGPTDMKPKLAYTTTMALGIMTMFLGGRSAAVMTAAVTFLLVHALYKAALFLAVGIIDHEAGTRQLDRLGGLARAMPLTALAVAAAAMSMAGFPLFFGFIGKEIMYKGALSEELFPEFATVVAVFANALMTAMAAILLLGPFAGKRPPALSDIHDPPWTMWTGPVILGGLGIVFGIIPEWVSTYLIQPAVWAFHPSREEVSLALFHGFNVPLLLSVLTLSMGALFYFMRRTLGALMRTTEEQSVTASRAFESGLDLFLKGAKWITGRLQNGSLHTYMSITLLVTVLAVALAWGRKALLVPSWPNVPHHLSTWGVVAIIAISSLVVLLAKKRLVAIGGMAGVGSGVALIFLMFGAPDIALTQLLIETLTVIIISLVLLRLPPLGAAKKRPMYRRIMDGIVALSVGWIMASLLIGVLQVPMDRSLTTFFEGQSYLSAHGRNIVNVILVDFRSLDTWGEITVVVLAGWASVALILKSRGPS
jgi:multicomponent Na+:H+ antiporter subunit A